MRKFLLATTAVLSGMSGVAGVAHAQTTPAPVISQFAGAAADPNAVPSTFGGVFTAVPGTTPPPSTLTVRLDGRINFYAELGTDSGRNPGLVTTAAGTAPVGTNTKLSDFTFENYVRLYPSFDGVAANGLKYGGFVEVRQDNAVAPGGGVNSSISAGTRSRGELYVRDNYVYLGADQFGFLRLGSGYGPSTMYATGTFENFNDGAWNGDAPDIFTGNTVLTWPFPDVSTFYSLDKAIYLSPQFAGFDFSGSFAPSTANVNAGSGSCSYANTVASPSGVTSVPAAGGSASGCDATSATSVVAETKRARDITELYGRYRGAFGPVGLAVEAGYILSGKTEYDGTTPPSIRYHDLGLYDGGAQVTFGGLAVGGHIMGGKSNTGFGLLGSGGKDYFAWMAGASYAIGPVIVGGSFFTLHTAGQDQGASIPYVGSFREKGVAAGGTYNFAPGMNIFLSYLYGDQHENGVDLLTGVGSSAAGHVGTHNSLQAQGISLGTQFKW